MSALRAGFAEADITPPIGTHKIGWLRDVVSDRVLDPLCARAMAVECAGRRIALIQLDTLSVRWTQVSEIRRRLEDRFAFPGDAVMVAATHNHAGPAVANCGDVRRDDAYLQTMVAKVVSMFGEALAGMENAEIGFGSGFEWRVPHNRRVVMRDGTVRTHGTFNDPDTLCLEGPVDPEVAVMAARARDGRLLGAVANFACHPTHHGDGTALSAGFPGVLARQMKERGCPVTLFLDGASGNISEQDPCRGGAGMSKEEVGAILADDVSGVVANMAYGSEAALGARSRTVRLPFRRVTDDEVAGTVHGAQRFIDPAIYERDIPRLLERIRRMGAQPAQVQALFVNDRVFVGIPAELFVQVGLRIKEGAWPKRALVVGQANGMVGYVPHGEAFRRGGYETTFAGSSRLAPEAGEMLASCALELIWQGP